MVARSARFKDLLCVMVVFFFFNDTATTEIYTLSLHDALPICKVLKQARLTGALEDYYASPIGVDGDRKSTRLNSSHSQISYAVFCLKKQNSHRPCCIAPSRGPRARHKSSRHDPCPTSHAHANH